ncbi:MAG: hypothetical protein ACSLFM_06465 [Tepidiformaceae bacterium]
MSGKVERVRLLGVVYAVGGAFWFGVAMWVAARYGGDPSAGSDAFYLSESLWLVVQLLLLAGFFGLISSNALGRTVFDRVAIGIGLLGHALFVAAEVHSLLSGEISDLLAAAALVSAVGFLLIGIAVIRGQRWRGWARFIPLLTGIYFFVGMLPFIIVAEEPNMVAIGGWGVVRVALGLTIRTQGVARNDSDLDI